MNNFDIKMARLKALQPNGGAIKIVTELNADKAITEKLGEDPNKVVDAYSAETALNNALKKRSGMLNIDLYNFSNYGYTDSDEVLFSLIPHYVNKGLEVELGGITSGWDATITSMGQKYLNDTTLYAFPLVDTSNVTDFKRTFNGCSNLSKIALIDTSAATNIQQMFERCTNLKEIPAFNFSNVTYALRAFRYSGLESLPMLDFSKCTNLSGAFSDMPNLTELPDFDYSSATDVSYLCDSSSRLKTIPAVFNFPQAANIKRVFGYCGITTAPVIDAPLATTVSYLYEGTALIKAQDIDFPAATSADGIFMNSGISTAPAISLPNVTSWYGMFYLCPNLVNVPNYDLSNVNILEYMLCGCTSLIKGPALQNTASLTAVDTMYTNCSNLEEVQLFDTSNVKYFDFMVKDCPKLRIFPQFDMSNAIGVSYLFHNCSSLSAIPLLNWTNVTATHTWEGGLDPLITGTANNTTNTFVGCTALKDLGGFEGLAISLDLSDSSEITLQSIENVVNYAATVTDGQIITLHPTAYARVTDSVKAKATEKGWSIVTK